MPDSARIRSALPSATSKVLASASRGPIARAAAKALVAGSTRADAIERSEELAADGHRISWLPLLDAIDNVGEMARVRDEFLHAMDDLAALGTPKPDLTIDLASFGILDIEVPALDLITALRELGQHARNVGVTLTLTISNAAAIEAVYVLAQELRQDFPEVGVVIPTRLRRGHEELIEATRPGNRVRLTTARLDPAIGHTSARHSGNAFVDAAKQLLRSGAQVSFETDDVLLLDIAHALVERFDGQEAEVLTPLGTQTKRAGQGPLASRILVPYGEESGAYVATLVASRPSIALHVPNPMRRRG